jgi:type IV pilus biogenesis protein CpaD/CtpE
MQTPRTVIALLVILGATDVLAASPVIDMTSQVARPGAASDRIRLTRESWARPRSGFYVAQLDELNALIRRFNAQADSGIVIRYARGDEGSLWAAELRAWLVALGIPSTRIELVSVAQAEDVLIIENHSKGEQPH